MTEFWGLFLTQMWNAIRLQLAFWVFVPFFTKREGFRKRVAGAIVGYLLLLVVQSYILSFHIENDFIYILLYFIMSLYSILFIIICFRGDWISYIVHAFSASILSTCVVAVRSCFLLLRFVYPEWTFYLRADGPADFVFTTFVMAVIYYLIYRVYSLRFCEYKEIKFTKDIMGVYAVDAVVLAVIHCVANIVEDAGMYGVAVMLFLVSIAFGVTTMYMQYAVFIGKCFELQKEKESTEKKAIESISRETFELYNSLKENMDILNIKCHDIKHRILDGYPDKDEKWARELIESINVYDRTIKTGNEELDTVLTHHQIFFEQNDIRFTCVADGTKLSFMELADVYILFGNACSNVGEYLSTIDKENRFARMWIKTDREFLLIHMENYFQGELNIKEGLPLSEKGDLSRHGFGIKSMKMIAEKYSGEIEIKVEGNLFHLNICIPIPTE